MLSIADARALPINSIATIEGVLTSALGAVENGRVGFVQDPTAGIAVYLDAAAATPWSAGTVVRLTGQIDERYAARTIRVALVDVVDLGMGSLPTPAGAATGAVNEALEGQLVRVGGVTVGSPSSFADGTGLLVDDGSGQLRVVVGPAALGGQTVPSGTQVSVVGPVGQRDSSGTGTAGYRVLATEPGSFSVLPDPSPSPTPVPSATSAPTPGPSPTATPSPTAGPTASPSPTPSPSPSPSPSATPAAPDIATARATLVGTRVRVTGTVIAEAGRLGLPPVFAIGDETGGLPIRLASGMTAPARGAAAIVEGVLAAPYGQLELRLVVDGLTPAGAGRLPEARPVAALDLGETSEGWLVQIDGTIVKVTRATSGDISVEATDLAGQRFRILADASSGLTAADFANGRSLSIVGIVGQRASRKGALDGYRIWVRDRGDLEELGAGPSAPPAVSVITIRQARAREGVDVVVEGMVIAGPALLDATGRRVVIADGSAGIEAVMPVGESARVGDWLRISGKVGRAWGAPRITAAAIARIESRSPILPETLRAAPGPAHEWRLVRISGTVADVRRLGSTWRAELSVGSERVVITGLAGAGIASTALVEGHPATIIGIVRRPYPTATDRRYQIVPRGPADVALGPAGSSDGSGGASSRDGRSGGGSGGAGGDSGSSTGGPLPIDVDLATLAEHVGQLVRVGGLVVAPTADGFTLDDATATAAIVLSGAAADFIGLLEPGDAVNASGIVERRGDDLVVVVDAGAGLVRVGDLGQALPVVASTTAVPEPAAAAHAFAGLGSGAPGLPAIGVSGLALVSLLSVARSLIRRRQAARQVARVTRARLAALAGDARSA